MTRSPSPGTRAVGQRGAASLVVVMLLFLALSLTAAYTSRNLIFERNPANQSRSTAAFEAAEAGIGTQLAQRLWTPVHGHRTGHELSTALPRFLRRAWSARRHAQGTRLRRGSGRPVQR
jgi:hypothetical protein